MIVVPSLSTNKAISNTIEMIAQLFKYFVIADYSQSNTFKGSISSLKDKLTGSEDPEWVKGRIHDALVTLYSNHFKQVDVEITYKDNLDVIGVVDYTIYVSVLDYNNEVHSLAESISTGNGDIKNIDTILDNLNKLLYIK
jgi:hypothetical protein